ncbi:hypothetical protein D3C86_2024890 [compost metagenome]
MTRTEDQLPFCVAEPPEALGAFGFRLFQFSELLFSSFGELGADGFATARSGALEVSFGSGSEQRGPVSHLIIS